MSSPAASAARDGGREAVGPPTAMAGDVTVTGPLPVTAASYPFGAADHLRAPMDLSKTGYIEEEFVVSGKANVYDWPDPSGPAVVRTPNAPYATRVLVRRPGAGAHSSGNVVVEMLNPTNLFDLEIGWALSSDRFMKNGDVWVGVTSKPIAIQALKKFNARRYAALSWANPATEADAGRCAALASDSSASTENGLLWDIFSQIGVLARGKADPGFLGDHPVEHVYGFGYSQSGGLLDTYIAAIRPLAVKANGNPIFDGYVAATYVGLMPINQCAAAQSVGATHGAGVPLIRVLTQSEYGAFVALRRPDSDEAPDAYRQYEVAGAAHATAAELELGPATSDIMATGQPLPPDECNGHPRSKFPLGMVFNSVWANLDAWVRSGTLPPHADPIATDSTGATQLDTIGNAVGGLRTPVVDAPAATWFVNGSGSLVCYLSGYEVPLSASTLGALYTNHAAYVAAVTRAATTAVVGHFLTADDAATLEQQASTAQVP